MHVIQGLNKAQNILFGNTYQIMMRPEGKSDLYLALEKLSEDEGTSVEKVTDERFIVGASSIMQLTNDEIVVDFAKEDFVDLVSVRIETNQSQSQKTKDFSVFNMIQKQFAAGAQQTQQTFVELLTYLLKSMDMRQLDKQILVQGRGFSPISEKLLKNLNIKNDWGRTPLMQAIYDKDYNLALALVYHPEVDVTISNGRYNALSYIRDWAFNSSDEKVKEIEKAIRARTRKNS